MLHTDKVIYINVNSSGSKRQHPGQGWLYNKCICKPMLKMCICIKHAENMYTYVLKCEVASITKLYALLTLVNLDLYSHSNNPF